MRLIIQHCFFLSGLICLWIRALLFPVTYRFTYSGKKRSCFEVRSSSFRHWTCLKNENGAGRDKKNKNKNKETVSVNKSNHKSKGFRNGSNTLTLFLGWIKLNLFLFWTYLFLLYIFYCILFCFWFQFYAVTFRTFVRFETIARKIWTIFLPQGHLEK